MKIKVKDFQVPSGKKFKLQDWPTIVKPFYTSKKQYHQIEIEHVQKLDALQRILYASNSYALLLIFQGMDCSGKDGAIRHVFSGINPQGCEIFSFKQPSAEELQHDFLWRTNCRLPERGRIGVFNRSYYEEVLVVRVHPDYLLKQGFSKEMIDEKKFWERRYRSIIDMEEHLNCNHTRIIKFYLHLSKEEQKNRLISRIDDPSKNWKISLLDIEERTYWKKYMHAYEDCISATSTKQAPWYVIPADDKENARLIISQIVLDRVDELQLDYPKITAEHKQELISMRKNL